MPEDISNATVIIEADSQSVNFTFSGNGIYRDLDDILKVLPGIKYSLYVNFPDGNCIIGQTILPGPFTILQPPEDDTLTYYVSKKLDTLKIAKIGWTPSYSARFYKVYLKITSDTLTA
jgi:hypothetical protein